jgi:hypothetical protein
MGAALVGNRGLISFKIRTEESEGVSWGIVLHEKQTAVVADVLQSDADAAVVVVFREHGHAVFACPSGSCDGGWWRGGRGGGGGIGSAQQGFFQHDLIGTQWRLGQKGQGKSEGEGAEEMGLHGGNLAQGGLQVNEDCGRKRFV